MNPLLSIVVPTKNRYEYLESFVLSFVENVDSDIELIIQDNSEVQSLDFVSKLDSFNDSRIKYNYLNQWVSVVQNCDLAIEMAKGDFITMIGDDDGVLFEVSKNIVSFCKSLNYEAAIVNKAEYYWPDTSHAVWGDLLSGSLFFKEYSGRVEKINVNEELNKVLNDGAAQSLRKMPRIYHGFVSRVMMNELKSLTGTYFPGPSPDMANAVGLCKVVSSLVEIDLPAVISGHSKKSTGGMGGEKKHHGKIENQKHLPTDTALNWSNLIPKFWSGPTIYAESARVALFMTNREKQYKINYSRLYSFCLIFEYKYTRLILAKILVQPLMIFSVCYNLVCLFISRSINYVNNFFKYNNSKKISLKANDIFNAQVSLLNILKIKKPIS